MLGVPTPDRAGERLRAVVACRPGSLDAPRRWWPGAAARLSAHKVPRSVILVPELPRTARGKLDRGGCGP